MEVQANPGGVQADRGRGLRQRVWRAIHKFGFIVGLLTLGYQEKGIMKKRYVHGKEWLRLKRTLELKIQNIVVVSGLVLTANVNVLATIPGSKMTYTSMQASFCGSLISVIFGLLCLWTLSMPDRLQLVLRRDILFQILFSVPCVFGGAAALAFFVTVGSWAVLDQQRSDAIMVLVILLSAACLGNAGVCFILGSYDWNGLA